MFPDDHNCLNTAVIPEAQRWPSIKSNGHPDPGSWHFGLRWKRQESLAQVASHGAWLNHQSLRCFSVMSFDFVSSCMYVSVLVSFLIAGQST